MFAPLCLSLSNRKIKTNDEKYFRSTQGFPKYPIGFSDHSENIDIAIVATSFGACMIEKHFTLDKKKIGMDNNMATEPNEMECSLKSAKKYKFVLVAQTVF